MTDESDGEDADFRIEWSDIDKSDQTDDKESKIDETVGEYRRGYAEFGEFDTAVCSAVTVFDPSDEDSSRVVFTWEAPPGGETDVEFHLPEEIDDLNEYLSEHEVTEPSDMIGVEHPYIRGKDSWHLWHKTTVIESRWVPLTRTRLMWIPGSIICLTILGVFAWFSLALGSIILFMILFIGMLILFISIATIKVDE